MNQLCKVCGELAAGFHFGAFTCEGCKSFFGRTYNNQTTVSKCKNYQKCIITKTNRTACKECRLKKCLLVGMSKNGSRYGRRSNWFKIHCLLNEQNGGEDDSNYMDLFSNNCNNDYLIKINELNCKEEDAVMIKRRFSEEKHFWPISEMCDDSKIHEEYRTCDVKPYEQIEPIDLSMKLKTK